MINQHLEAIALYEIELEPIKTLVRTRGGHILRYIGKAPNMIVRQSNDYLMFSVHKDSYVEGEVNVEVGSIVQLYVHGHYVNNKETDGLERNEDDEFDDDDLEDAPYEKSSLDVVKVLKPWVPRVGDKVSVNGFAMAFFHNRIKFFEGHQFDLCEIPNGPLPLGFLSILDNIDKIYCFRHESIYWCVTKDNLRFVSRPAYVVTGMATTSGINYTIGVNSNSTL